MFGASHGRCGSVFWSLSGAEVHQPSDSRSAEVLEPSFFTEKSHISAALNDRDFCARCRGGACSD